MKVSLRSPATFHGLSTHAMANTTLESQYPMAPAFAAGCLWGGWSLEVSSGIHPKGATSTRKSATASAYHLCLRWVNWTLMAFVWAVSGNKMIRNQSAGLASIQTQEFPRSDWPFTSNLLAIDPKLWLRLKVQRFQSKVVAKHTVVARKGTDFLDKFDGCIECWLEDKCCTGRMAVILKHGNLLKSEIILPAKSVFICIYWNRGTNTRTF